MHESPHKDRNRRVCVSQWWLFPLSSPLPCCVLTNGPMRKAQLVLITFCSATKHHLTFVHKRCTGTLSSRKMLGSCSPHFWRPRWNTNMHRRHVCTHLCALRSSRPAWAQVSLQVLWFWTVLEELLFTSLLMSASFAWFEQMLYSSVKFPVAPALESKSDQSQAADASTMCSVHRWQC